VNILASLTRGASPHDHTSNAANPDLVASRNSKRRLRLHWYQWNPEAFAAEVQGWAPLEEFIYRKLLDYQWTQRHVPDVPEMLRRITGLSPTEWKKSWPVVEQKFPVGADGLRRNPGLEELRQESVEISETKKQAGRAGGLASAAKRQANAAPYAPANAKPYGQRLLNTGHNNTEHRQDRTGHVGAGGASEYMSASENPGSSGSPFGSGYPPRSSGDDALWDAIDPPHRRNDD
jgi:hypothetical protein